MAHVVIVFRSGEETFERKVALSHLHFPNGGSWSFFVCPSCSTRRVRTLRLFDGRPTCWRCDGLLQRSQGHDRTGRIERLKQRLYGGKEINNRGRLERSLRRALIVERRRRLADL